ncbi:MAG: hypothetical protein ACR2KE_03545 [Candidatus Nanopelagicales bacterium]
MTTILTERPGLELVLSSGSPAEVLASPVLSTADVALIDLALGAGQMTGIELGMALRDRNADIGIVIHSQYPMDHASAWLPRPTLMGWSTLPKTGDLNIDKVVELLRATARGIGSIAPEAPSISPLSEDEGSRLARLSPRQRAAMGLLTQGLNAAQIADQLGATHEAVRQDLARAYRILVPEAAEGSDRRTQAVLEYVRLSRDPAWTQP